MRKRGEEGGEGREERGERALFLGEEKSSLEKSLF
jgi:hypothetical protein